MSNPRPKWAGKQSAALESRTPLRPPATRDGYLLGIRGWSGYGALPVSLTNPEAVRWFLGILADRLQKGDALTFIESRYLGEALARIATGGTADAAFGMKKRQGNPSKSGRDLEILLDCLRYRDAGIKEQKIIDMVCDDWGIDGDTLRKIRQTKPDLVTYAEAIATWRGDLADIPEAQKFMCTHRLIMMAESRGELTRDLFLKLLS